MYSTASIWRVLFTFLLAYGVLICVFQLPKLKDKAASGYASGARSFLAACLPKGYLHAELAPKSTESSQTNIRVLLGNKAETEKAMAAARAARRTDADLVLKEFKIKFEEFFLYSALFFLALVAITPIAWVQRLKIATIGFAALLLLNYLKLLCYTLYTFSAVRLGVYELSGLPLDFVTSVYTYLKVGIGFIFATVVWAGLVFLRKDWQKTLKLMAEPKSVFSVFGL